MPGICALLPSHLRGWPWQTNNVPGHPPVRSIIPDWSAPRGELAAKFHKAAAFAWFSSVNWVPLARLRR